VERLHFGAGRSFLSGKPGLADRQQSYATNRPRQEVGFQQLLENKSRQSIGIIGGGAPSGMSTRSVSER
jgi:hypothetical protein